MMVPTWRLIYWWDGRGLMLWLLSRPPGSTCRISFVPVFSFMYFWVLIFALSPFYILIYMFLEMMHWWVRGLLPCKPNIYVSWSTSELRVMLAPWDQFKPSSKIVLLTVPRRYFFSGSFCVFVCLGFLMLSRLFIAALCSPAGKGPASWLLLVMLIVFLLLSNVVSWIRCGTWLYHFLIFAIFLTLTYFDY